MDFLKNFDIMSVFDIILLVYGIYTIYSAVTMKKRGVPSKWLVPEQELNKCRDVKGYVDAMHSKTLIFGVITAVYGVVSSINRLLLSIWVLDIVCMGIFLASCIVYIIILNKARSKFF